MFCDMHRGRTMHVLLYKKFPLLLFLRISQGTWESYVGAVISRNDVCTVLSCALLVDVQVIHHVTKPTSYVGAISQQHPDQQTEMN